MCRRAAAEQQTKCRFHADGSALDRKLFKLGAPFSAECEQAGEDNFDIPTPLNGENRVAGQQS